MDGKVVENEAILWAICADCNIGRNVKPDFCNDGLDWGICAVQRCQYLVIDFIDDAVIIIHENA